MNIRIPLTLAALMTATAHAQMNIHLGGDNGPEEAATNYEPGVYSDFFDGTDLSDAWTSGSLNLLSSNPASGVSFDLTFVPSGTADLRFRSQPGGLGVRGGANSAVDNGDDREFVTITISNVQGLDMSMERLVFTHVETRFLTAAESAIIDGVTVTGGGAGNSNVFTLAGDNDALTLGAVPLSVGGSNFVVASLRVDVIPEPGTFAWMAGLLGLARVLLQRPVGVPDGTEVGVTQANE